jgi:hypothetical protein
MLSLQHGCEVLQGDVCNASNVYFEADSLVSSGSCEVLGTVRLPPGGSWVDLDEMGKTKLAPRMIREELKMQNIIRGVRSATDVTQNSCKTY